MWIVLVQLDNGFWRKVGEYTTPGDAEWHVKQLTGPQCWQIEHVYTKRDLWKCGEIID